MGSLVSTFVPTDWPSILGGDDTIERRGGEKIGAKGCYRESVLSTQKHLGRYFELKWVLPFLAAFCPSLETCRKEGRRHKTSHDWLCQRVNQVRRWWAQSQHY